MQAFTGRVGFIRRAGFGGRGEAVELRERALRKTRYFGNLLRRWSAAQLAFERKRGASDERHAFASVARQRIEPAKLIEHRAANTREAIAAHVLGRSIVVQQRFDERDFPGAGE